MLFFCYRCDPIKMDEKSCGQYLREEPLEAILSRQIDKVFKIQEPEHDEKDDDSLMIIDRKIKRLVNLAEGEDTTVEESKQRIGELKKQEALLLAKQITKLDYSQILEELKTVASIYPYMTREEKSRLWHLLITRIEAGKSLVSVYWRGGGEYTFRRNRLAKNLKVLNTKGCSMVDPGNSSWNLLLAELSKLSKIVEQSTNDRDHESSSTAAPELRER